MITGRPTVDPRPVSRSVYDISYTTRSNLAGLWTLLKVACVGGLPLVVMASCVAAHVR